MKIAVYEVNADAETGEWIGQPVATGELVDWREWNRKADTDTAHFDTYEVPILNDNGDRIGEETRAIICNHTT